MDLYVHFYFTFYRLLAQKETPMDRKMQSLSLGSEATPPTTPTKRGTFNFMSPTKVILL